MAKVNVRVVPKDNMLGKYLIDCMGYWGSNKLGSEGVFNSVSISTGVDEKGLQVWVISDAKIPVYEFEYLGDWVDSIGSYSLEPYPRAFLATDINCIIIGA